MTVESDGKPAHQSWKRFALDWASSSAVIVLVLLGLSSKSKNVLWHDNVTDTVALVSGITVLVSVSITFLRFKREAIVDTVATLLVSSVAYALVLVVAFFSETAQYRDAERVGASWPVRLQQNYQHVTRWRVAAPTTSRFGQSSESLEMGRFVLTLSSSRDETDLTSPDGDAFPSVDDFLLQINVQYVQGPEDGTCGVVFGFQRSEHWFDYALGPAGLRVTQDVGGLPHRYLFGPTSNAAFKPTADNSLAIFKTGSTLEFFVNKILVTRLTVAVPRGKIWLAPQATNSPDLVACAYSQLVLRGTS